MFNHAYDNGLPIDPPLNVVHNVPMIVDCMKVRKSAACFKKTEPMSAPPLVAPLQLDTGASVNQLL